MPRRIAALCIACLSLVGCRGDASIAWRVELGPDLAGERAFYVEGRLLRGGCEGTVWYEEGRLVGSRAQLPMPDALDDGLWGFAGRGSNERCEWFAEGCVERRIPDDLSEVVVVLEPATPPLEARCTDCDLGVCASDPLPPPRILTPAPGGYFVSASGAPTPPTFVFEPSRGATRHVVEVSARCDATRAADCDFDPPVARLEVGGTATTATLDSPLSVETIPPVGARYALRISACDAEGCSASLPRVFHVGRRPSDVNGDGYGDAIVGAPGVSGAFTVFGDGDLSSVTPFEVPGPTRPSRGSALAVGDFDADGFSDLLLGSPFAGGAAVDVGYVELFPGGVAGPQANLPVMHPEPMTASTFGTALSSLGDVDGDGFDDFAVGAPQHGRDAGAGGAVFVFFGAARLDSGLRSIQLRAPESIGDGRFGQAVAGGDVDGDGFSDLVVGAPRATVGALAEAGRAWIFRGPLPTTTAGVEIEAAPTENARFGAAVAGIGDLDGDGRGDLVIGAPGADGGAAFVYLGGPSGLSPGRIEIPNAATGAARFGAAVAGLGDVDGDGVVDLAVDAPDHDGTGGVFVYSGSDRGSGWLPSPILDAAPAGALFGAGLAGISDADGDGDPELAVGGPGAGGGRVDLFVSTGRDVSSTPVTTTERPTTGDAFGTAIANPAVR